MSSYNTPGNIAELSEADLVQWNANLVRLFDGQIRYARSVPNPDAIRAWMFNPITEATDAPLASQPIVWTAFPKRVTDSGVPAEQGWREVDADRNRHEEYCEWEVARNQEGKLVRATFTCETEDYFDFLARHKADLLLDLYQRHVSPQVVLNDLLLANGAYNPQNRWSFPQNGGSRGLIMHMGQVNNSFGAAVNLAAVATWPRVSDTGQPLVGEQELIRCARFGEASRHSDPHIGSKINQLVRAGNEVALADPVGLYIHSVDMSDWDLPADAGGVQVTDLMRVVRGSPGQMLRVIFEAPANAHFVLGDVRISGTRLKFGSQIAEKIQVRLTGIARSAAAGNAPSLRCDGGLAKMQALFDAAGAPASFMERSMSRVVSTMSVLSPE